MKRYNSKIGIGILVFLIIIPGGASCIMIYFKIWLGFCILLSTIGFIGYLFLTTYYLVSDKLLTIKSGFIVNKSVNIDSILIISESHNPLSSPAGSLDRLEIRYSNTGVILVSPKDKIGFIKHLKHLNLKIKLRVKDINIYNDIIE
jgi:hypothetical protein